MMVGLRQPCPAAVWRVYDGAARLWGGLAVRGI